ncbi:hypothetical protein XENOCAPTIV_021631 [Xenoophorus captivus]|uniref:Uncharacterized protein n=1 Tax=Xenoophorus captivus TaxID=1517983 RepID=A0ABV0RRN9_9TELE
MEGREAVKSMSNGIAPVPDGLPAEFWPLLAPTFHRVVTKIQETSILSPNMHCANINLILKTDEGHFHLLTVRHNKNANLKTICRKLATRPEKKIIYIYILHPDQDVFIKILYLIFKNKSSLIV